MSGLYETLRSARQVAPEEDLFAQAAVTGARTPEQAVRNAELTDSVFTQAVRGGLRGFGSSAQELVGLGGELAGQAPDYAAADDLVSRAGTSGVQDVRQIGSLRDALSFGQYATGNAIGSMLVPAAGAAAGLLTRNKAVGSMVGAGLGAFIGEAGEQARTLRTDPALAGMSAGDRAINAGAVGAVNAGLEAITPARAVTALTKAPAKGLLREVGKSSLIEGATEAAQNTSGQLGHMLANPNKEFEFGDVVNAAATGAVGGGGIQLATRGAQEARDRIPELLQNIRDRKDQAVTAVVDKKNEVIDTTRQIADDGLNAIEEIRQFAMRKAPLKDPDGMPDLTDAPEDQDPVAVAQKIRTFQEEGRRAVDEFVKANPDLGFDTATPEGRAAAFQEMQKRTYEAEVEPLMQEAVKGNVKPEGKASLMRTALDAELIDAVAPIIATPKQGKIGTFVKPELMLEFSQMLQQVMTGARPLSPVAWRAFGEQAQPLLQATQDVLERNGVPLAFTAEQVMAQAKSARQPLREVLRGAMKPEVFTDRDLRETVLDKFEEDFQDFARSGRKELSDVQRREYGKLFENPDQVYKSFVERAARKDFERSTREEGMDAPRELEADVGSDIATQTFDDEGNSDTADLMDQDAPERARWVAQSEAMAAYETGAPMFQSQAEKAAQVAQRDLGARYSVSVEPTQTKEGVRYVVRVADRDRDAAYTPLDFTRIKDTATNLSGPLEGRVKHGIIKVNFEGQKPFNVSAHSMVTHEMNLQPKGDSNTVGLERIAELFSIGVSKLLSHPLTSKSKPFEDFSEVDTETGELSFDFPPDMLVWRPAPIAGKKQPPILYKDIRDLISKRSPELKAEYDAMRIEARQKLSKGGRTPSTRAVEAEVARMRARKQEAAVAREQTREREVEAVPPVPGDTLREQTAGGELRPDSSDFTVDDSVETRSTRDTTRELAELRGEQVPETAAAQREAGQRPLPETRRLESEEGFRGKSVRSPQALPDFAEERNTQEETGLPVDTDFTGAGVMQRRAEAFVEQTMAPLRAEPTLKGVGEVMRTIRSRPEGAPSQRLLQAALNDLLNRNPELKAEVEARLAAVRKESPRPEPEVVRGPSPADIAAPPLAGRAYDPRSPGMEAARQRGYKARPDEELDAENLMREVVDNIDQMFPRTPAEQRADLKKALDSDPPTNVREAASRLGVNPRGVNANALARDRATIDSFLSRVLGADYAWHFRDVLTSGSWMKMNGIDTIVISTMAMDRVGVARHEAMHAMAARLQEVQPRAFRALSAAASSPHVMSQLRRILANEPAALDQLKDPEEAVAYMYQYWADGKLTIGPQSRTLLQRFADFVSAAYGAMTGIYRADPEAAEKLLMAFNRGEFANKARLKDDVAQVLPEGFLDKLEKHFAPIMKGFDRIWVATEARMRAFGDPMVDRIAEGFYGSKGTPGFVQARVFETNKWLSRLGKVLDGATEKELENILRAMRQQSTNILGGSPRMDAVRAYLDDIHEYQVRSNVGTWVEDPQRGWVMQPMGKVQNYFPRAWDFEKVAADKAGLQAILEKGGYKKDEARDIVLALSRPGDTNSLNSRDQTSALMFYAPHTKQRQIKGIPESELAPYMKDDLREILAQYTSAAVRRAEYSSRFGMNGNVIENNLADSQLTNPQLAEVRKMISALDGTIGNDIPETMRKVMSNAMAYQNIRLLPLALFSSLSDSIGIGVRGGTLKEVGTAFVEGLKGLIPGGRKDTSSDAYHLAVAAGAIQAATDFDMANYIVGSQYMSQKVRKANDWLFKVNGMESWNRTMRIQASAAAEQFLIRHATSPNEHSARYLEELDLKPSDVQVQNGRLVLNDKTKNAVAMWVDGAILRPSAALRPVWMSDPHWMLVSHLKQFTYNFQQVILKRVAQEAGHGNLRPFMMLLGYMPAVLAADALRVFLTPSDDDDNWRKSWDWKDYALSAVTRAGVTGTAQFGADMGARGVEAALGPTVEQLIKLSKAGTDNVDQTDRWWAKQTIPGVRYF